MSKIQIKKVAKGKTKDGFYIKYEISRYDADGKALSDFRIKAAIADHMHPTPVVIKKRREDGYYVAHVAAVMSGYQHIYAPVLN